jgi:hypothetical protein
VIRRALGLLAVTASVAAAQGGARCGVERWNVKVMLDADAASVVREPAATTIAALVALPKPRESRPSHGRLPLERRVFRVRAILVEQRPQESDSDLHLLLADPADPTKVLVAEIPDSACALGSRYASDFAEALRAVRDLPDDLELEVEGVAFWDDEHGQLGSAPNGIELHPVLKVVAVLTRGDILMEEVGAVPVDTTAVRVWLNRSSKIYHCPGSANYGTTRNGAYMPESAAIRAGARPAGGRPCR